MKKSILKLLLILTVLILAILIGYWTVAVQASDPPNPCQSVYTAIGDIDGKSIAIPDPYKNDYFVCKVDVYTAGGWIFPFFRNECQVYGYCVLGFGNLPSVKAWSLSTARSGEVNGVKVYTQLFERVYLPAVAK